MSYNIRSIREISTDPSTKFVSHLAKKISDFQNASQTQDLENKEDIYSAGQDVESFVGFHDLISTNNFTFDKMYFPPFEPDLSTLRVWFMGTNLGNELTDISGFNRVIDIKGEPQLIDGTPFDQGIHDGGVKSLCLRFNDPASQSENTDYVILDTTDTTSMNIVNMASPGKSYFIRFRLKSLAQQDGSDRRLFEMTDDATPSNGIMLRVSTSGALKLNIKKSGTEYNWDTASGVIAVDTIYDVWVTYTISGNVVHIYVNNADKTLSAGSSPNWHGDLTNTKMYIFRRGEGSDEGYVYGDLYDFRIYDGKVVNFNSVGSSVLFDGTNDYIDLTNDATLWSQSLTKFSWSVWVYPTNTIGDSSRDIIRHGNAGGGRFRSDIAVTTGNIRFLIRNNADSADSTAQVSGLVANQWQFVTGVYDSTIGSANVKVYLNGTVGATTANHTEAKNLSIEFKISDSSADFKGNMKDFRWWTTKALTPTEIGYVMTNSHLAPMPNYWLPMFGPSGNPVDLITETKVGTLTNGASWVDSEVGNHYTNKWTIANIPFGQVAVSDYYGTYTP